MTWPEVKLESPKRVAATERSGGHASVVPGKPKEIRNEENGVGVNVNDIYLPGILRMISKGLCVCY